MQNLGATGTRMQTKIKFSAYSCLPTASGCFFFGSGDLGTSPFFWQRSVKAISLTVTQRTTVSAYKIGPARKSLGEQNCSL
jgi:hypothetical protein